MRRTLVHVLTLFLLAGCGGSIALPGFSSLPQGDASADDAVASEPSSEDIIQDAETALTRIVLGSRAQTGLSQSFWHAASATYPELFIFAGDSVGSDLHKISLDDPYGDLSALHQAYADFARLDGFQQLREATAVHAIRHDDDVDAGDVTGVSNAFAKHIFLDFWGAAENDPRRNRSALYSSRNYGPAAQRVQVIMLDVQSARVPGSLLGDEQWRWLEAELEKPAELRLIVSSTEIMAAQPSRTG